MQFLQINLAKMRGNRVVKVAGEPFIAIPMANLYAAARDAVYANFIMNETTSYGHTFVISERRRADGERMPIIGNASPFAPMAKDDADVVPDNEFANVLPQGNAAQLAAETKAAAAAASDPAANAAGDVQRVPSGVDPETGEIKRDPIPFDI